MTKWEKIAYIEKLKQGSNIWAMLAAAGFVAALFQGFWFLGALLGLYSTHKSFALIDKRIGLEQEVGNE